ncbi:histone family protein DNA-binding protein [Thermodesulfatator indicus DSM 15286]|uniref:Integration host factor subunit alpha n=1 Tax=Thermodesulfatator indicus (strain DSM 15286 / JCM 11887 / CIR29812) TaxID=667014 RepID=F8AAU7_THEID|nr:integration host factor subunit alpha [Thermodesulfatator indicus]AEH45458.1 histone family protein DNA-binding protein [Thermodesulfatator indicus DSM 15286]
MTVTKKDLALYLHENLGFSVRSMKQVVDNIFEQMKLALERGEKVKIVRFGFFTPYRRPTRKGVNPKDGSPIIIEGKKTVIFHPSNTLKNFINEE